MIYIPSERELRKLHCRQAIEVADPIPIKNEQQAREYLRLKVERYKEHFQWTKPTDVYIAKAMNALLATGFTYLNLYTGGAVLLTEPHVASALAFNSLIGIDQVPDEIDRRFGVLYV